MKAELEPKPLQGIKLTAETEEEAVSLVNLWLRKSRAVELYYPREKRPLVAEIIIRPTEEE